MQTHIVPISKEGTLTVPDAVRERLGLDDVGTVAFVVRDDGEVVLSRRKLTPEDVFGSIPDIPGTSDDFDVEIEQAIEAHLAEKYKHWKR